MLVLVLKKSVFCNATSCCVAARGGTNWKPPIPGGYSPLPLGDKPKFLAPSSSLHQCQGSWPLLRKVLLEAKAKSQPKRLIPQQPKCFDIWSPDEHTEHQRNKHHKELGDKPLRVQALLSSSLGKKGTWSRQPLCQSRA